MNLYEIRNEYLELLSFLEENEGELTPELEELMLINKETFKEKSLNYIKIINKLKSDLSYAEEEISRIQSYINKKNTSINRLETTLLDALKLYGDKDPKKNIYRFEVGTFRLSTRQSESVNIDIDRISNDYKEYTIKNLTYKEKESILELLKKELKLDVTVPKKGLKELISDGNEIEGASIKTNYSLIIK
jgi:hypothetical protein